MSFEEIKEELEWSKISIDLQNQFMELAEMDSNNISVKIETLNNKLNVIKEEIKRYFKEFAENKSGLLIGAVDGCKSLTSKESIGAGCVIYTYGYVIIKGKKLHNDAKAGRIIYRNVGEEVAKKALGLILTYLERKCALSLVEKCDYVLLMKLFWLHL
jgi:hypothetical protein